MHRHVFAPTTARIGEDLELSFSSREAGLGIQVVLPMISLARLPQPVVVPGLGTMWADPSAGVTLAPVLITSTSGRAISTVALNVNTGWVGTELYFQGLLLPPGPALTGLVNETLLR